MRRMLILIAWHAINTWAKAVVAIPSQFVVLSCLSPGCISFSSGSPGCFHFHFHFRGQLWNTFHRPELLQKNMDTCLKDLGLDYVDHVQLHYSFAMVPVDDEK